MKTKKSRKTKATTPALVTVLVDQHTTDVWLQQHEPSIGRHAANDFINSARSKQTSAAKRLARKFTDDAGQAEELAKAIKTLQERAYLAGAKVAFSSTRQRVEAAAAARAAELPGRYKSIRKIYAKFHHLPKLQQLDATAEKCGVSRSTVRRAVAEG